MNKIFAFDYMLSLFEQWYKDEGKESMNFQNCSKLSVLKLFPGVFGVAPGTANRASL